MFTPVLLADATPDPNAMWREFVAPIAALLGVGVTLFVQGLLQRAERRERIKYDIFLAAAADLANRTRALGTWASAPTSDFHNVSEMLDTGAMSKLHVIAKMGTLEALAAADRCFLRGAFKVINSRIDLESATRKLDALTSRTEVLNRAGVHSQEEADRLLALAEQLRAAREKHSKLTAYTSLQVFGAATEYGESLAEALVAGRKELGLEKGLNPKRYLQLHSEVSEETSKHIHDLLKRVEDAQDE